MRSAAKYKQIAIVGVGLIGGSIGLAVKKRRLASRVVGIVRRESTAREALKRKIVDKASTDLSAVRGSDVIVLCTPISTILQLLPELRKYAAKGTLVLDVGSTKEEIDRVGKKYFKKRFGGSHPMAGSHETGMKHADPDLFEGETCFSTSGDSGVSKFWRQLGSRVVRLKPQAHDIWVAQSSHLPHILSFALFHQFPAKKKAGANPSIRDLNRLSKSDPKLWADIVSWNARSILIAIRTFQKSLSEFERALKTNDHAALVRFIREANRRSFRTGSK